MNKIAFEKVLHLPHLVIALLFGTAFVRAASFMCMPFLAIYLSQFKQYSPWMIGAVVGIGPLANVLGGFLSGQLSDRIGRVSLINISLFTSTLVCLGFYCVSEHTSGDKQIIAFALLNLLSGLVSSIFEPVSQALLADETPLTARSRAFQLRYTAINIGAALGPLAGVAFGIAATPIAFLISGLIYLSYALVLIAIFKKLKISQKEQSKLQQGTRPTLWAAMRILRSDQRLFWFILSGVGFNVSYSQLESTLSQHLTNTREGGTALFSTLLAINAITVLIAQAPVYIFTKKNNSILNMLMGTLLFAVGLACVGWQSTSIGVLYLGMIIASVGEILVFPTSSHFIDRLAPESLKGAYFGTSSFRKLGLSIGPVFGGAILQSFDGTIMFLVMAGVALGSGILAWLGTRIPHYSTHALEA